MTNEERDEKKDALRRYEEIRREQLGAAINLSFGLSSAAVGFCLLRITDKDSVFTRPGSYFFVLATFIFITTVAICTTSTWTRLRDFRLTVRRVRRKLHGADDAELKRLRETTKRLGKWTWRLFYLQLATFGLGVVILTIALSLLHYEHVFPKSPGPPNKAPRPAAAAHSIRLSLVSETCELSVRRRPATHESEIADLKSAQTRRSEIDSVQKKVVRK